MTTPGRIGAMELLLPPPVSSPALAPLMPPPGVVAPPPPSHSQVGGVRADFGIRLASWLLDGALYGLLATAFIVPGIVLSISAFSGCFADQSRNVSREVTEWEPYAYCPPGAISGTAIAGGIALIVCGVLVSVLLYVGAMGKTGQPWGARITHIKVVDEQTGAPIGFGRALGRSLFANFISMSVFHLGFLWMLWDDKQQTWHDKVVKSVVVRC